MTWTCVNSSFRPWQTKILQTIRDLLPFTMLPWLANWKCMNWFLIMWKTKTQQIGKHIFWFKGPFILLCRMISIECPTNYECKLVSCHLKLIWSLNFEIVLKIDLQMALFSIWRSSAIYWCAYQTISNTKQDQFRA